MDRLWAKFVGGSQRKVVKKSNHEQKKPVDTKEENKKFTGTTKAADQEKKPLLEQDAEEDDDDASDSDVFEDALSDVQEEDREKRDVVTNTNDVLKKALETAAVAPMSRIPCGCIWSALAYSADVHVENELNVLTLRILKEPMKLSSRTTLLHLGQHVLLITAYFKLTESNQLPIPFTTHMAISVSYTEHTMYPSCTNNGLVTAAAAVLPRARNVFCIKPANPVGAMPHVRYGQPIVLQLIASQAPIYLAGGTVLEKFGPLCLTTNLNDRCYFKFVSDLQEKGDNLDNYPVASHATFLIQHVASSFFLSFESHNWAPTTFGMENTLKLQPLDYFEKDIATKHFFKAYLN